MFPKGRWWRRALCSCVIRHPDGLLVIRDPDPDLDLSSIPLLWRPKSIECAKITIGKYRDLGAPIPMPTFEGVQPYKMTPWIKGLRHLILIDFGAHRVQNREFESPKPCPKSTILGIWFRRPGLGGRPAASRVFILISAEAGFQRDTVNETFFEPKTESTQHRGGSTTIVSKN